MPDLSLEPGAHLGRYVIVQLLGTGGMGQVYLAHDERLQRPVALKLLTRQQGDEGPLRRFRAETLTLAALNHPNIVTIFDAGELAGVPFLAMERIEGETLRQRLALGPLPLADVLGIFPQVARALAAAHAAGVIHRDVKPENVMVRPDGLVKVLDFGLAKLAPGLPGAAGIALLSGCQPMIGTPAYMAPEQMRGAEVDPRTDLWGLAVTLHEALAGRRPFPGESLGETIAAVLEGEPTPLPAVGPPAIVEPLAALLRRCLAKELDRRPPGAARVEGELQEIARRLVGSASRSASALVEPGRPEVSLNAVAASPHPLSSGEGDSPPGPWPGALPQPWTPFVRRGDEVSSLLARLREGRARLITLTGPGGTGKTRLALETARRFAELEGARVVFVPLEAVHDPLLALPAVARAFGLEGGAGGSGAIVLRDYLRRRRALLVLDNCEQVLAAAPGVGDLLAAAEGLQVLATSREPLRLRAEQEVPVPPLPVPEADDPLDPVSLARVPAVALFLERARAVRPELTLDGPNATLVAEICRRLDGLPLALELAAARTKLLPLAALRDQLARDLSLLAVGTLDLAPRQRTMEAAIAWSYDLLDEAERRLFRRLAVFRGSFDLGAAAEVAGDTAQDPSELLARLASLAEKSLLRAETEHGSAPRFALLQILQAFGEQRLREAPAEHAAALAAHRAIFLRRAEEAGRALADAAREETLAAVGADHDNFRAAIERALAARDGDAALRLVGGLWQFWYVRGHYEEARRSLEAALALAGSGAPPLALRATLGAGVFAFLQCDYAQAETLLDRALGLAQSQAEVRPAATALQYLGSLARERGRCQAAIALHREAAAAFRALGDRQGIGRALNLIALASWLDGDFAAAVAHASEARELFDRSDDCEGSSWARLNLAAAALWGGEVERATAFAREARERAAGGAFREGIAWSLELLGRAALERGDPAAAAEALPRALELHARLGDRWRMASVLEALAGLRFANRSHAAAARLLGAAAALRERAGMPVPRVERPEVERLESALGQRLGAERLAAERSAGAALPRHQLVVEALRSLPAGPPSGAA